MGGISFIPFNDRKLAAWKRNIAEEEAKAAGKKGGKGKGGPAKAPKEEEIKSTQKKLEFRPPQIGGAAPAKNPVLYTNTSWNPYVQSCLVMADLAGQKVDVVTINKETQNSKEFKDK
jgi:hypothetical protein